MDSVKGFAVASIAVLTLILGLVGLINFFIQRTDERVANLIRAGVDPGKARCAIDINAYAGCQVILADEKEKVE